MPEYEHPSIGHDHDPVVPSPSGGTHPGQVNIIFHGLFLLLERSDCIEVLIPNMRTEHVYLAGSFLCETTLSPLPLSQPYMLGGVRRGNARLPAVPTVFRKYDFAADL